MKPEIILASSSKRRVFLLRQIGLRFASMTPDKCVEVPYICFRRGVMSVEVYTEEMAYRKALSVSEKFTHGIFIGADTVVQCMGIVFGKPGGVDEAIWQLSYLSGKFHTVITGLVVICLDKGCSLSEVVKTRVWIRRMERQEIISYVRTGEPLDKAGSYAIQEKGALFVEKIEGDYFNVVGLPIFALGKMLRILGYSPIP